MGNCCPAGTSYAVGKPPQIQNPDLVADYNTSGSYRKKDSVYYNDKPVPLTYDNEALDLRERTLNDEQPARNGPVIMQPVSEGDVITFFEEPSPAVDADQRKSSAVRPSAAEKSSDTEEKPRVTTTVVFQASTISDGRQSREDEEADNDPDYDIIRPTSAPVSAAAAGTARPATHLSPTYDDIESPSLPPLPASGLDTTEVKMRLDEKESEVGEDDPYYSTAVDPGVGRLRSNTRSSAGSAASHQYSQPDTSPFRQSARDTGGTSMAQTDDDYYTTIPGDGLGNGQRECDDDSDVDYYEIGDSNMTSIIQQIDQSRSLNGASPRENGELDDEQAGVHSGAAPGTQKTVTDLYAKINKSKKKSKVIPSLYSTSKDTCEEDRELNEIWMEIETIEEKLRTTLTGGEENGTEEDKEEFYFDFVNDTITDLSRKNDTIWKKQAEGLEDYDNAADWATPYGEENDTTFEEIEQEYTQAVNDLNKKTARELLDPTRRNEDEVMRLLSEHRETQLEIFKYRQAEKNRLDAKLKEKLRAAKLKYANDEEDDLDLPAPPPKFAGDANSDLSDSDSDTEGVKKEMGQFMTASPGDEEPLEDAPWEISSDEASDSDSDSISFIGQEQATANTTLKNTLKDDVTANLNRMSVVDFENLMSLYREEREGLKQIKEAEKQKHDKSLWDKLAQRKQTVDQYVHESESENTDGGVTYSSVATTNTSNGNYMLSKSVQMDGEVGKQDSSVTTDVVSSSSTGVSAQVMMTDADTGMSGTLTAMSHRVVETNTEKELSDKIVKLDDLFIEKIKAEKGVIPNEELHDLVKNHLETVTKLRREKVAMMRLHEEKAMEILRKRTHKRTGSDSSSSSSESEAEQMPPALSLQNGVESDFEQELNDNKESVLDRLSYEENLDSDKVNAILKRFHHDQEELMRRRQLQKGNLDKKLQDKLEMKKKEGLSAQENTDGELKENDNQFYYDLITRRNKGEITDADIGRMIEDHLNKQDEELRHRRHEDRQRRREDRRRANSSEAQNLMQEEREKSKQMKRMRKEEKAKMDYKLQEKLKKRKQGETYDDKPELPAPRVGRRGKEEVGESRHKSARTGTEYENIEMPKI